MLSLFDIPLHELDGQICEFGIYVTPRWDVVQLDVTRWLAPIERKGDGVLTP